MQSPEGLRETLSKVLALEQRTGYGDTAVFGGLEAFIERFAAQKPSSVPPKLMESLRATVGGYGNFTLPQRRETIRELEALLTGLETITESHTVNAPASQKPASDEDALTRPVRYAKGVGERRAQLLSKLGIKTVEDLLLYFPRRLEDRSLIKRIGELREGDQATVHGRIRAVDVIKPRPNLEIVKLALQDNTGVLYAVWFNQPWLKTQFAPGERLALFGTVERSYKQIQMSNPVWEPADKPFLTGRLVPIYPATEGLKPAALYRLIQQNLNLYRESIPEILPAEIRERQQLLPRALAIEKIHSPSSLEEFEQARHTLVFEEFFIFQLGVARERQKAHRERGPVLKISDERLEQFLVSLPFRLTGAQEQAIAQIRTDLASGHPMNRLLQGEVGSGKTIVAAAACLIAVEAGYQAALMAPTEILAEQHGQRLRDVLAPLGVRLGLLIGSLSASDKEALRAAAQTGELDLLIGTHALLEDEVRFKRLGLVVIDEQQRFGVIQRAALEQKGTDLHVLVMSATPIPRTITLTLYGQFDITILDQLPFPKQIKTYWLSETHRPEVYQLVAEEVRKGVQAYIVYPLVEESEELDLQAATQMKDELAQGVFKEFRVGLLHGRMSNAEKQAVMAQVREKSIDVLVSTSIIEVGIDVPDASILVIEHADRFGLSQLHQLRGRIGRAGQRALCFAIANASNEESRRRLEAFRDLSDGFAIAEEDLKIRGTGELLGLSQHGLDTTFRVADLLRDFPVMKESRVEALSFIEREPETPLLKEFERRFGTTFELARF
jgi:ATP-dependent DNA helicase RecG